MVDGCLSYYINVVSGVSHDSVHGSMLFSLYSSEQLLFSILENKLYGFTGRPLHFGCCGGSPLDRVAVAESLNRDINRFSELCGI